MRVIPTIIVIALCLFSAKSFALSCAPFLERIIAECSQTACEDVIFVEDIATSGACGRLPKISKAPPSWVKPVLESEVKNTERFGGKKVFELTIADIFWYESPEPKSLETYQQIKNDDLSSQPYPPQLEVIENKSFSEVQVEWEEKVKSASQQDLLTKVVDWAVFIISLIALFFSVKWFREVFLKGRSKKYLAVSISIQIILFVLGLGFAILGIFETFLLAAHALLVPIVWLYEIVYSIFHRFRKRAAN